MNFCKGIIDYFSYSKLKWSKANSISPLLPHGPLHLTLTYINKMLHPTNLNAASSSNCLELLDVISTCDVAYNVA